MYCKYCGKSINDDSKFCKFCGNKLVIPETDKNLKSNLEIKNPSAIVKNYRVIFNVFFYTVTAFYGLYLLSGSSIPNVLFGHIMNILLNPFTWAFYVLIFIFKKNPKVGTGISSIVLGLLNIFFVFGPVFILGR